MTEKLTKMTVDQLKYFEYLCNKIDLDWQYYDNNEEGTCTLVTDWNRFPFSSYTDFLEENVDVELRYEDETDMCDHCMKAIETVPSSWDWLPEYVRYIDYPAPICRECFENDEEIAEEIIEEYQENASDPINRPHALVEWTIPVLKEKGWICLEDDEMACKRFETGWHPGQDDDPQKVSDWMKEYMPKHKFVFVVTSKGQFDIDWAVFIKKKDVYRTKGENGEIEEYIID